MSVDIFLRAGESNPNDVKLCDPTTFCPGVGEPVLYVLWIQDDVLA